MKNAKPRTSNSSADRFILRFHKSGQRNDLKQRAARNKRSLNAEILFLIEYGLRSMEAKVAPNSSSAPSQIEGGAA